MANVNNTKPRISAKDVALVVILLCAQLGFFIAITALDCRQDLTENESRSASIATSTQPISTTAAMTTTTTTSPTTISTTTLSVSTTSHPSERHTDTTSTNHPRDVHIDSTPASVKRSKKTRFCGLSDPRYIFIGAAATILLNIFLWFLGARLAIFVASRYGPRIENARPRQELIPDW